MDKKTTNKRKSSATPTETPKKIKKTTNAPASLKIDKKSLKSANKSIQNQINENKSHKTPPLRKQINGKQITLKVWKTSKQIEEDGIEDESDDSMYMLNGKNGNSHDAVNSDNEVVDEADSDEGAESDEVNSDKVEADSDEEEADSDEEEAVSVEEKAESDEEKAESDEEVESDKEDVNSNKVEADSDEAVSDEEVEENEEDSEDEAENKNALKQNETIETGASEEFKVFVSGLMPPTRIEDVFRDCNIKSYELLKKFQTNENSGCAIVFFNDKESEEKALKIKKIKINGKFISVYSKFGAHMTNFNLLSKLEDIFKDCKIQNYFIYHINFPLKRVDVHFEDEESLQEALCKHQTYYDGHVIRVTRKDCSVHVKYLKKSSRLEDVFSDCDIHATDLKKNDRNQYIGVADIHFKNEESLKKALSKNNSIVDGKTIKVELYDPQRKRLNFKLTRNNSNPIGPFKQRQNLTPTENYNNPRSKIAILEKKLRLEKLKLEAKQLEQEIYGEAEPFNKSKHY